jgi:diadenylate cyclase
MDAQVSPALLVSIFQRQSPLHDGAVIIQKNTVAAAACFLPLTTRALSGEEAGSRHRAAIGITEETDCISIMVSEQTGMISLAANGQIENDITVERVKERFTEHFGRRS